MMAELGRELRATRKSKKINPAHDGPVCASNLFMPLRRFALFR